MRFFSTPDQDVLNRKEIDEKATYINFAIPAKCASVERYVVVMPRHDLFPS